MMISTFELKSLFPNKNTSEITNEDIIEARKRKREEEIKERKNSDFYTYTEIGIVLDEYGQERIGLIEKTGFERD